LIDAEYLKGKVLHMAASAEAKTLGLRVPDDLLRDVVEQSGPSLGRIVSELEKMLLFQGSSGRGGEESVAVTSSPPLYLLADALTMKDKRRSLGLLDEALRQGEAGLRVLATVHGTVRKLAMFRALRNSGVSTNDAGAQLGIFPFKLADTERAARSWSDADLGRAFAIFAEADRRLKLSAPTVPVLTHALARATSGGRA
jgi:DNA polymerase III delta subunit